MSEFLRTWPAVVIAVMLAGCDTLDSDWAYDAAQPAYDSGTSTSGDNRSHQQKLDDKAWWDEYNR